MFSCTLEGPKKYWRITFFKKQLHVRRSTAISRRESKFKVYIDCYYIKQQKTHTSLNVSSLETKRCLSAPLDPPKPNREASSLPWSNKTSAPSLLPLDKKFVYSALSISPRRCKSVKQPHDVYAPCALIVDMSHEFPHCSRFREGHESPDHMSRRTTCWRGIRLPSRKHSVNINALQSLQPSHKGHTADYTASCESLACLPLGACFEWVTKQKSGACPPI